MRCRQATELLSDAMDRPLRKGERYGLRLHLFTCSRCRRYRGQIRTIRLFIRALAAWLSGARIAKATLPDDARRRIAGVLERRASS